MVIDVRLFINASGGHGKQTKRQHHLLFHSRLFGNPIGDAVDEQLQRIARALLAGHLINVAFEGDPITAANQRPDEVRADHFLVQRFAAAAEIAVQHLVAVSIIGAHFSDGFLERLVPLLLLFPPLLTLRADCRARSDRGIIDDKFIDDDSIYKRGFLIETRPVFEMLLGGFGLSVDPNFCDEPFPLTVPIINGSLWKLEVVGND